MASNGNRSAWLLLWISLICCIFEGAVRKWIVGDTSIAGRLAYLSKDIGMALFVMIGAASRNSLSEIGKPFLCWGLGMLGIGALLSSFSGINLIGTILTFRTFFILPLAAWTAGRCLPPDALRRYAYWVAAIAVLMCPLGILQFYSPAGSPLNRYSTEGEGGATTAGVSERVRATGTFSYITGFSEFAELGVWASIVIFSLGRTSHERWVGYAGMGASLCCGLVTVSRSVVLVCAVIIGIWALFGGQVGRKLQIAATIVIAGIALLTTTSAWNSASEIASTVYLRHESVNDSVSHRLWYHFILPFEAIEMAPLGNGLGSEQSGRSVDTEVNRSGWTFESAWGRTILELGLIGFVGFLVTWGIAFAPWQSAYSSTDNSGLKIALGVTGAALALRALLGFQFNHVTAYFFWSVTACVIALGNDDKTTNNRVHPHIRTKTERPTLA